ncbi:hypothetical protein TanjilG_00566 [Lupinus angustifolius]|nr:hypothetical protein TanjilG_00566 [Lupinus angustifolius]
MGILHDDVVLIRQAEKEGDPTTVITVNCPDKTGLGCDLCRIILFFSLNIVRADTSFAHLRLSLVIFLYLFGFIFWNEDVSTDGKWCYIVFWVVGKQKTNWSLLKKRLVEACPTCSSASGISYYQSDLYPPKPPDVFLLKFCCHDRKGLLHDVTEVLSELEIIIHKVKVSTTPDGKVMDLFFITDTRELLHTKKRKNDTIEQLTDILDDAITIDIELVGPEVTACSQASSFLPNAITEDVDMELPATVRSGVLTSGSVSISMDNLLSPGHTLVQIMCQDHKGLLYDIMRTLKDYNIKISYGRFTAKPRGKCEIDLFIMQSDGKKIVDPIKQSSLSSRLRSELLRPLRVATVSRGPDTELLVANPVELSGNGRPLVFFDITLALKVLGICIFSAEIGRHTIGDREFEVYKMLLDEGEGLSIPRKKIEEGVWKLLMGWE